LPDYGSYLFSMTSLESLYTGEPAEAQHLLNNFWTMITEEIKNVHPASAISVYSPITIPIMHQ